MALETWAQQAGYGFLAFDYCGHGLSGGAFEDATITTWRDDTLDMIAALTDGPLVLVGSSMGGWMALLAAAALGRRVQALVLIAPAADFTEKLIWPELETAAQTEIMQKGMTLRPSDYGDPYPITRALIEDGRTWQIMAAPIEFSGPVRILQGGQDRDVPWQHAFGLVELLTSDDVVFTLIKDGDHRLSREPDIERLLATCGEIGSALSPGGI